MSTQYVHVVDVGQGLKMRWIDPMEKVKLAQFLLNLFFPFYDVAFQDGFVELPHDPVFDTGRGVVREIIANNTPPNHSICRWIHTELAVDQSTRAVELAE